MSSNPVISSDTQRLIKSMMKSSKLSHNQQRLLDACLHDPSMSFPSYLDPNYTPNGRTALTGGKGKTLSFTSIGPRRPGKKLKETILAEGAYEREAYRPAMTKNMDIEKTRLQRKFEDPDYDEPKDSLAVAVAAREEAERLAAAKVKKQEMEEEDEFDMLLGEINERKEWIETMIAMGKGDAYRLKIQTEINQRISRLEKIHKDRCKAERRAKIIEAFKEEMKAHKPENDL